MYSFSKLLVSWELGNRHLQSKSLFEVLSLISSIQKGENLALFTLEDDQNSEFEQRLVSTKSETWSLDIHHVGFTERIGFIGQLNHKRIGFY